MILDGEQRLVLIGRIHYEAMDFDYKTGCFLLRLRANGSPDESFGWDHTGFVTGPCIGASGRCIDVMWDRTREEYHALHASQTDGFELRQHFVFGPDGKWRFGYVCGAADTFMLDREDCVIQAGVEQDGNEFNVVLIRRRRTDEYQFRPDDTFGVRGISEIRVPGANVRVTGIRQTPDGGYVVWGTQGEWRLTRYFISKLRRDGSLDDAFAASGFSTAFMNRSSITSLHVGGDGSITASGISLRQSVNPLNDYVYLDYSPFVVRLNAEGDADSSFGNQSPKNGFYLSDEYEANTPVHSCFLDSGEVVLAFAHQMVDSEGNAKSFAALRRLTADGVGDQQFNSNESLNVPFAGTVVSVVGVARQGDGIAIGAEIGSTACGAVRFKLPVE